MVSCGMTLIKYLLFVFNLLFAVSGIAILAIGATILALHQDYRLLVNNLWSVSVLLMIVGTIVFLVSFLGCCGAIRNSNVMILSFAILLIIIFLSELTACIAGYVLKDDVQSLVQEGLNNSLDSYTNNTNIQEAWNIMQYDFHCCGVSGPSDWPKVFNNNTLPHVCCPDIDVTDQCTLSSHPYPDGCLKSFENFIMDKALIVGSIGLGVCFIQIVGVVLACCLARAIRKDYETV